MRFILYSVKLHPLYFLLFPQQFVFYQISVLQWKNWFSCPAVVGRKPKEGVQGYKATTSGLSIYNFRIFAPEAGRDTSWNQLYTLEWDERNWPWRLLSDILCYQGNRQSWLWHFCVTCNQ